MKELKDWVERMAKDGKFADDFKGVKTLKQVVALAQKKGYKLEEEKLEDFCLKNVSGGFGGIDISTDILVQQAIASATAIGDHSSAVNQAQITQTGMVGKKPKK